MAENKRFYWLKLKSDFFKRPDIMIIEAMEKGKDYVLFYLKLLCSSVETNGELRFSEAISYDEQMLATITNTDIETVKSAMNVFKKFQIVEVLEDETILMSEVDEMLGSECESAERVRNSRKNKKMLQCNGNVTKCNTDIDIDIDIDRR